MYDVAEWMWAAGLMEGEGCFTSSKNRGPTQQPSVKLQMTDEDVVRRLHDFFGFGHTTGPYDYGHKPVWHWHASQRDSAFRAMAMLYPFMGERRRARILEVMKLCYGPEFYADY